MSLDSGSYQVTRRQVAAPQAQAAALQDSQARVAELTALVEELRLGQANTAALVSALTALESRGPRFEGTEFLNPADTWRAKATAAITSYAPGVEPSLLAVAVFKLLTGRAMSIAAILAPAMPEDVFAAMRDHFPAAEHERRVLRAIDSGAMWAGIVVARKPAYLRKVFETLCPRRPTCMRTHSRRSSMASTPASSS